MNTIPISHFVFKTRIDVVDFMKNRKSDRKAIQIHELTESYVYLK